MSNVGKHEIFRFVVLMLAFSMITSGCDMIMQRQEDVSSAAQINSGATPDNSVKAAESGTVHAAEASRSNDAANEAYLTGNDNICVYADESMTRQLTFLPCGAQVNIIGELGGAAFSPVKISASGLESDGYVTNKDLTTEKAAVTNGINVKVSSAAAVYSDRASSDSVIGEVPEGSSVTVLAKTSGGRWCIMTDDLMVGYVSIMDIVTDGIDTTAAFDSAQQPSTDESGDASRNRNSSNASDDENREPATEGNTDEILAGAVSEAQSKTGGNWSAGYIDLTSGTISSVNNTSMQAASLIKLFIMGAVYDDYDTYAQKRSDLDDLIDMMITVSDNNAANTLVNLLGDGDDSAGMAAVTNYAHMNGYSQTSMGRLLLESNINGDNYTSAMDCANFLAAVYRGQTAHSDDMMSLLMRQTRTSKIPAGVPVKTANKTGELFNVQNDAAIVFADRPYVLCVLSEGVPESAADSVCRISAKVYEATQ